jgi:hypothetical protein
VPAGGTFAESALNASHLSALTFRRHGVPRATNIPLLLLPSSHELELKVLHRRIGSSRYVCCARINEVRTRCTPPQRTSLVSGMESRSTNLIFTSPHMRIVHMSQLTINRHSSTHLQYTPCDWSQLLLELCWMRDAVMLAAGVVRGEQNRTRRTARQSMIEVFKLSDVSGPRRARRDSLKPLQSSQCFQFFLQPRH